MYTRDRDGRRWGTPERLPDGYAGHAFEEDGKEVPDAPDEPMRPMHVANPIRQDDMLLLFLIVLLMSEEEHDDTLLLMLLILLAV